MKTYVLILSLFFVFSCIERDCCVLPPDVPEYQFNGEWELVKIVNGFAQTEQTGNDLAFKEVLTIDAGYKIFTRSRDNIKQESNSFKVGEEAGKEAVVLIDEQMYQWYSFEEKKGETFLVLYEKCPLGAELADGSYYYYSKR